MMTAIPVGAAISPDEPVWWMVVVLVAAALVGAWAVARRTPARAAASPMAGSIDADIIPMDLLEPDAAVTRESRIVRVFEIALLIVLVGYAFFDRGFAWLHIPGTPLFIGELILLLGALAVLSYPRPFGEVRQ